MSAASSDPPQPSLTSARGRLRHLPPVAVPVRWSDLRAGVSALYHPQRARAGFRAKVQAATGSTYCALVTSGRAALALILSGLKARADPGAHDGSVIVPAYSCPTTVQSVRAAGLTPRFCDVDPGTLDLDRVALDRLLDRSPSGVPDRPPLAIVVTHLYGLAQDVRDLLDRGVAVIEDAAQAYGARLDGRMVGTWGAAGLYSLGRGKGVPAGHGGVIVVQPALAPAIARAVEARLAAHAERGPFGQLLAGSIAVAAYAGYGAATHPRGWWWITHSPLNPAQAGMDLGTLPEIAFGPLSPVHAGIAGAILDRLDTVETVRRHNAARLRDILRDVPGVTLPTIPDGATPVMVRQPVVLASPQLRDRRYDALYARGIGVSRSYTRTLPDLYGDPAAASYAGAQRLAQCLLTLPTHDYLSERDFGIIRHVFHQPGE